MRHWWENTIFYQIYMPSFCDGNQDGIGDFAGIKSKLPYLKRLGVGGIWLTPFYKSPKVDQGYDISDYYQIDPDYGTMEEFEDFLQEAHKLGIKVISDMVINHTSSEHKWFLESKSSDFNPKRDWYIWRKPVDGREPNNWESFFGEKAWEYDEIDDLLLPYKKEISSAMAEKSVQDKLHKRVEKIISKINGKSMSKLSSPEELINVKECVETLIGENLWTLPGGAWCSAGIPVFDKMAETASYPMFLHFDINGKDVTELANLDCQTPFYFAYLDKQKYNEKVIDGYIEYLDYVQSLYNFDAFRVDHLDHVVDEISQKDGFPISYRCPAKVLGKINEHFKRKMPYCATLAEYMLGNKFYKEYHNDMKFDVLWGDDISSQSLKTPAEIIKDNQYLANFNIPLYNKSKLSILKTYNNQDGEFSIIDRYPAQLGESGAMYKWFKYKFLPGGKFATRPIMYVDGDESFTQTGIRRTIDAEVPMIREKNYYFYAKFDAISRFVKSQDVLINGEAQIIAEDNEGFATWMVTKEPLKQAFLIISNYNSPFEKFTKHSADGVPYTDVKVGKDIYNKTVNIPGDYAAVAEYVFDGRNFSLVDFASPEYSLTFPSLYPGEFKIFVIKK